MRNGKMTNKSLRGAVYASLLTVTTGIIFPTSANSAILSFRFTDPSGDFSTFPNPADFPSITDIINVRIIFDTETGDFQAHLTSTIEKPFLGTFEPNFQYYNVDAVPFTVDPTIVRDWLDGGNRFTLSTPTTEFIYSGNNPNYMSWKVGDRVATSIGFDTSPFDGPSDWPTNQGFASNFYIFGAYGTASDILPISDIAIITAVPIPAVIWLFGSGLLGLIGLARRKA